MNVSTASVIWSPCAPSSASPKIAFPRGACRRAVELVEEQFGESTLPLQEFQFLEQGRDVLVIPPGAARPFSPIKQQWAFLFDAAPRLEIACHGEPHARNSSSKQLSIARRGLELLPRPSTTIATCLKSCAGLGGRAYQSRRGALPNGTAPMSALDEFLAAVQLDPLNGISRYNLGCVLEEQGEMDEAIEHLRRAARAMPAHADVHFNLALAYEKRGDRHLAREEWMLYLRYAPNGRGPNKPAHT